MVRPTISSQSLLTGYLCFTTNGCNHSNENILLYQRGESNAVVYSNSVLGARTEKYADYFDILAALVGVGEPLQIILGTFSYTEEFLIA